jgi:N-acetylglucosamine-6-phosphate deacetylase
VASLLIAGGTIVTTDGTDVADVLLTDGSIAAVGRDVAAPRDTERVDAAGRLVAPGLIDLQCNGGHGIDLTAEPERIWELAELLPRHGVTAWLPTIVSSPVEIVERAMATLARRPAGFSGAEPLGLHLEGPALNPLRRGAHPVGVLRLPTADLVAGWRPDRGVALVTLAPELAGGLDAVRALQAAGVVVAAGHTDATTEEMIGALDAGVTAITHLFNGMVPFAHREPGPVGVALTDARVTVGVIADGVHVHPMAVAAAYAAIGASRLALVTDAVAPMGLADAPDAARLADGVLAGSTLTLDQAVRNLVAFAGCAPHHALACASSTPAALLRSADRGCLVAGATADVVVLTPTLDVTTTVVAGHIVHTT